MYVVKVAFLAIAHALAFYLLWRGIPAAPAWLLPLALATGHLLLDAITLVVHWVLDNYFSEKTPVIGTVVYYFREHHVKPLEMFSRGYVDNNFENALIGLAWLVVFVPLRAGPFWDVAIGFGSLGSCYITLIHKWAHLSDPGPVARVLQRAGLVVTKRHHDRHHRLEGRHYGLAAGWCDVLFDRLRLLEALEWAVYRVGGAVPVHPRLAHTRAAADARRGT